MRELTHASLTGGQNSRTRFLDFGRLFNLGFIEFYTFFFTIFWLHLVHIKPMQPFPPINTPLNFHHFLTFSHSSPHSFTFIVFVFFSFFWAKLVVKKGQGRGKIGQPAWGTKRSILGVNVNLLLFIPIIFLPWIKRLFLGV